MLYVRLKYSTAITFIHNLLEHPSWASQKQIEHIVGCQSTEVEALLVFSQPNSLS